MKACIIAVVLSVLLFNALHPAIRAGIWKRIEPYLPKLLFILVTLPLLLFLLYPEGIFLIPLIYASPAALSALGKST